MSREQIHLGSAEPGQPPSGNHKDESPLKFLLKKYESLIKDNYSDFSVYFKQLIDTYNVVQFKNQQEKTMHESQVTAFSPQITPGLGRSRQKVAKSLALSLMLIKLKGGEAGEETPKIQSREHQKS